MAIAGPIFKCLSRRYHLDIQCYTALLSLRCHDWKIGTQAVVKNYSSFLWRICRAALHFDRKKGILKSSKFKTIMFLPILLLFHVLIVFVCFLS